MHTINQRIGIWPLSLEQIEATVASHLGPGRVPGNEQVPCFSRQMSMYIANRVGGWSTTRIGRFYNGRHHTTVLYAIGKVELLRRTDESIDALAEVLTEAVSPKMEEPLTERPETKWRATMIDAMAARVIDRLAEMRGERELPKPDNGLGRLKQCTGIQGSRMQNQRDQAMLNQNRHVGSSVDDFLHEEGILDDARAFAIEEALTFHPQNDPPNTREENELD